MSTGNPVLQLPSLQGEIFFDQVPGCIYTYDYSNKLFISSGEINHDMAEDSANIFEKSEPEVFKNNSSELDIWNYNNLPLLYNE